MGERMSVVFSRNGVSMPDLVRTKLANHLARLGRPADVPAFALAEERAEGFVEGVEAAHALTPASIEGLFIAVEDAAARRRRDLAP
ncbi:hypothetical protein D3C76_816660 [compost metagenome]|jgi:hypothetical protein|uniref:Uncharacterized protein n=2 Tax=Pseudomonas fluorescens group TaxID=136843 RepID=A0A5E6PEK1_PSEFL|nr:hypothetical protein PS631_00272 [Pseudomonas fluorescens]